mgnify:CR=1 FL=1
MTEPTTLIYRNIIQNSVKNILGDQALWLSMELWDQHFSDNPIPSIKTFSQQLCDQLEKPEAHSQLYTTLLNQFFQQRSQQRTVTVPPVTCNNVIPIESATLKTLPPYASVFTKLVTELFSQLGYHPEPRSNHKVYTQPKLRTLIGSLPLNIEKRVFWTQVLLKGEVHQLDSISEHELKEMFHNLYIAAVELFGPIETDQAVTEAIHNIERTTVGNSYPARNFL